MCQEHIWRKEDKSGCRSSILFEVESLVQHYWEAGGPTSSQGSSCLRLPTSHSNTVILDVGFASGFLQMFWGFKLRSSHFCGKKFTY